MNQSTWERKLLQQACLWISCKKIIKRATKQEQITRIPSSRIPIETTTTTTTTTTTKDESYSWIYVDPKPSQKQEAKEKKRIPWNFHVLRSKKIEFSWITWIFKGFIAKGSVGLRTRIKLRIRTKNQTWFLI